MGEWRQSWGSGGSWRSGESRLNNNPDRWQGISNLRPPLHPDVLQNTVPLWEKKYCTKMLRMSWKMLCVNQNYIGLCRNVMEWDDSGALEAFQNAKSRFCAEYHGAPCSIPLPDSNLYVDKVDYYAFVDPELVADLEKEPPPPVGSVEFGGVNSIIVREEINVTPSGWDDVEESDVGNRGEKNWDAFVEQPIQADGWRSVAGPENSGWATKERNNEWGSGEADTKVVCNDDTWITATPGWNDTALPGDSWRIARDNHSDFSRNTQAWKNKNWETNRRYCRKRDGGGRSNGRYTKPKFNLGVYQPNNNWRNCVEGNSSDSHYERKVYPKQPLAW